MRADKFFSGRYGSRTKAAEMIKRGLILRNGRALVPNDDVCESDEFCFLTPNEQFVSNGGYKLSRGLDAFRESVAGDVFCDFGASTGGFTDCLLQRGAARVFCVDVGKSQLDEKISADERVVVMDETNARYLRQSDFPVQIDGIVSDLSFISLKLILPSICEILPDQGRAFVLFKPQFECEGRGIGKSGIVPKGNHAALLKRFYECACAQHLSPCSIVNAPIREKKNIEYVIMLKKNATAMRLEEFLRNAANLM